MVLTKEEIIKQNDDVYLRGQGMQRYEEIILPQKLAKEYTRAFKEGAEAERDTINRFISILMVEGKRDKDKLYNNLLDWLKERGK